MLDRFVAFDVEMPSQTSMRISAIGLTVVENGKIIKKIYSLINPEVKFDPYVVELIGITQEMVADKPTFPEFWNEISEYMTNSLIVAHGASSDMKALAGCINQYNIPWLEKVQYTCTCDIALELYGETEKRSLDVLCEKIGFPLNHHNALSDSEGCAMLMLDYISKGIDIEKYIYTYDVKKNHKVRKNKPHKKVSFEEKVRRILFSLSNQSAKKETLKKNPQLDEETVIGVKSDKLYQLAAQLLKKNKAPGFLDLLPHVYYEEKNLHAILISKKAKFSACVNLIDTFLPYVESMETVDLIRPKIFKSQQPALIEKICLWIQDENPYAAALGINCAESYFFEAEYITQWLDILCGINTNNIELNYRRAGFFAKALLNFEEQALPYFENYRLDKWTHNMSLQKAAFSKNTTEEKRSFFVSKRIG